MLKKELWEGDQIRNGIRGIGRVTMQERRFRERYTEEQPCWKDRASYQRAEKQSTDQRSQLSYSAARLPKLASLLAIQAVPPPTKTLQLNNIPSLNPEKWNTAPAQRMNQQRKSKNESKSTSGIVPDDVKQSKERVRRVVTMRRKSAKQRQAGPFVCHAPSL